VQALQATFAGKGVDTGVVPIDSGGPKPVSRSIFKTPLVRSTRAAAGATVVTFGGSSPASQSVQKAAPAEVTPVIEPEVVKSEGGSGKRPGLIEVATWLTSATERDPKGTAHLETTRPKAPNVSTARFGAVASKPSATPFAETWQTLKIRPDRHAAAPLAKVTSGVPRAGVAPVPSTQKRSSLTLTNPFSLAPQAVPKAMTLPRAPMPQPAVAPAPEAKQPQRVLVPRLLAADAPTTRRASVAPVAKTLEKSPADRAGDRLSRTLAGKETSWKSVPTIGLASMAFAEPEPAPALKEAPAEPPVEPKADVPPPPDTQPVPPPPPAPKAVAEIPPPEEVAGSPFEVLDQADELTVIYRRSKLLRTKVDVYRTAVVDPSICDVVQYTPREISVIGRGQGATHVTFWFDDESYQPYTYLVRVEPDPEVQERREERFRLLETDLAELFPNSKVALVVVGDKLIVKGQARDAEEAAQIMAIIRGHPQFQYGIAEGTAADPLGQEATNRSFPTTRVINMLRIPGVHQVALHVKIAELNRSAAREFGVDLDMTFNLSEEGQLFIQSLLNVAAGNAPSILGSFNHKDAAIDFGIHYLEQHGVVRMLSEPTLVTLSGRPATFVAGGEFAVPTTVGVSGAAAVTTDFRAFGAIITFRPVVLDKDHIRLEVAPEFSQINNDNAVNGTPGLDTRAVTTTVEMREGQTLAIAGLLDDTMRGDTAGDLPLLAQIFGNRSVTRNETELIILVTPELIQPMEPEEVPPLPGFDVTEPTNCQFYIKGRLEGRPTHEYRSTVWPRLRRRYKAGGPEMISGPFGHGD
jgi:pilus assembly protein CpaC